MIARMVATEGVGVWALVNSTTALEFSGWILLPSSRAIFSPASLVPLDRGGLQIAVGLQSHRSARSQWDPSSTQLQCSLTVDTPATRLRELVPSSA